MDKFRDKRCQKKMDQLPPVRRTLGRAVMCWAFEDQASVELRFGLVDVRYCLLSCLGSGLGHKWLSASCKMPE